MPKTSYTGRHRPAAKPSRGRQFVVPVALLSSTVAGGLVIRDAGASQLSPEAAAMKNVSNSVAGLGLAADPDAVAAAAANRAGARSSRDLARAQTRRQKQSHPDRSLPSVGGGYATRA